MTIEPSLTASVVSHGQMELVNVLVGDLIAHAGPALKRLVVTINVAEAVQLQAAGAPFEVVVLRNGSACGFGANHNRAFRHCETAWFGVLNPDLRIGPNALAALCKAAVPGDGILAPRILESDGRPADSARRLPTPWQIAVRRLRRHRQADPRFEWLAGMCMLIDAAAFRDAGGFDERFFLYCEDVDLCLRMQLAGRRLRLVEEVGIVHDARRQSHRSLPYLGWHLRSLARLWLSRSFWSFLARRSRLRGLSVAGRG
jgi:N-acetylglucosaminyl-diphospho-decaprenol L-rhamnosyltransferase